MLIKETINERTPTYEFHFVTFLRLEKPEDDRIEVETCSSMSLKFSVAKQTNVWRSYCQEF